MGGKQRKEDTQNREALHIFFVKNSVQCFNPREIGLPAKDFF